MTYAISQDSRTFVIPPPAVALPNEIVGGALAVGGGGGSMKYVCVNSKNLVQFGTETNGELKWGASQSIGVAVADGSNLANEFWLAKVIAQAPVVVRTIKTPSDPEDCTFGWRNGANPITTQRITVYVYKSADFAGSAWTQQIVYDQTITIRPTIAQGYPGVSVGMQAVLNAASAATPFNGKFEGFVISPNNNAPYFLAFDNRGTILTNITNTGTYSVMTTSISAVLAPSSDTVTSVCYHAGWFYATVSSGNKMYKMNPSSLTPQTWTAVTLPEGAVWTGVAGDQAAPGRLVVSLSDVDYTYTSTNSGATWVKSPFASNFFSMRGVSYIDETTAISGNKGRFVLIGSQDIAKTYEACMLTLEYA